MEVLVFGKRVIAQSLADAPTNAPVITPTDLMKHMPLTPDAPPSELEPTLAGLQDLLWSQVGILRSGGSPAGSRADVGAMADRVGIALRPRLARAGKHCAHLQAHGNGCAGAGGESRGTLPHRLSHTAGALVAAHRLPQRDILIPGGCLSRIPLRAHYNPYHNSPSLRSEPLGR